MKCIKKGSEIQRVSDEDAMAMVKSGWSYCPKSEWKVVRGPVVTNPDAKPEIEDEPKSSKKDRQKDKRSKSKYQKKQEKNEEPKEYKPIKPTLDEILDSV